MTQHSKIINMCLDGQFHCQQEFRNLYIYSPHKRRAEIEAEGKWKFTKIRCQHNVAGQFDYMMVLNPKWSPEKEKERQIDLSNDKDFAQNVLC